MDGSGARDGLERADLNEANESEVITRLGVL